LSRTAGAAGQFKNLVGAHWGHRVRFLGRPPRTVEEDLTARMQSRHGAAGSVIVARVPPPGRSFRAMVPLCTSASACEIARPSPMPSPSWANRSNTWSRSF